MGLDGFILKQKKQFTFEKMLFDSITAAYNSKLYIFGTSEDRTVSNKLNYIQMNFSKNSFYINSEDDFIFYITAPSSHYDHLIKNIEFYNIAFIENLTFEYSQEILNFVYEYLKLNPKDYFWCDCDRYYSFEDISIIKSMPFNPNWYCNITQELEKNNGR